MAFVNDIASGLSSNHWQYVDDLTLLECLTKNRQGHMQEDLDHIHHWSSANHMKLNPSKCSVMTVSFTRQPHRLEQLHIADNVLHVQENTSHRILGITVQADLKWDAHVQNMISRANKKLYILKTLKRFCLPVNDLISIYLGYIRPLLEYATPVWNFSLTLKYVKAMENFQKRVCKIILGNEYKFYDDALVSCGILALSQRRNQLCIKFGQSLLTSKAF